MRVRLLGATLIVLVTTAILCVGISGGALPQEKKEGEGVINAYIENPGGGIGKRGIATITLYQDGKAIATKDVVFGGQTTFDKLSLGAYEVRFEALEHTTVVKRVLLREAAKSQDLRTNLPKGKGSVVLGAGLSIQELEARIKKLEDEVAKLQKK